MKAGEVLRILNITRPTLTKYVKDGIIRVTELPNGRYKYDKKSIYEFLNRNIQRKTYIYTSDNLSEQSKDKTQLDIKTLKEFCFSNNYQIDGIFIDQEHSKHPIHKKYFLKILDEVLDHKVSRLIIPNKDIFCEKDLVLLNKIFDKAGAEIIDISALEHWKFNIKGESK